MERRFRLTHSNDIQRVRRLGKSYAHPLLVLVVLPNESSATRCAVVAGRSVGGAVLRNRAKRVMRAALGPLLGCLKPGWDLVLIARNKIQDVKSGQVQDALEGLLLRAGVLRETNESEI